ncbi:molybdate ABC transporter permease subunit [Candidatus Cetobacterium colombiensis]|jgi:molybdate transport system permease protein|uniref:ABC transporter permease subunit n=1 Tax=Candidatus Cetobacterium colombiensis TaxID=3073100 RepID=A0ABU4W814_9FUSO|nr:ABC transporter permease subunit [Candidatus Cetobacterium colombiensis]MDX8335672.1 ABC transporter permease subunit [Candidatus Cetobacterium colombiensis]
MISPLKISLFIVFISIFFNIFFSIFIYFFLKNNSNLKKITEFFLTLPIFLPPSVIGYVLIIGLGKNSILGNFFYNFFDFRFIFSFQGAVLAAIIVSMPIFYQSIKVGFDTIDKAYIETAQCLGISTFNMIRYVYLPLGYRKVFSGVILGAGRAFGEFGATILIAGNIPGKTQTLPLALYSAIESGNYELANKILIILFIFSGIFLFFYIILTKKES